MLETTRLKIVLLEEKYLEQLRELRNDPTTSHWLTDITPITKEAQKEWFEKLQKDKTRLYLSILMKATIPGLSMMPEWIFIGILRSDEWDRVNRSVRVGCDIAKKYRGNGLGSEALSAFVDYLFRQQNMNKVWLLVAEKNEVAINLYEKLGFKKEGKQRNALFRDGKYHNYLSMSLLEKEWKRKKSFDYASFDKTQDKQDKKKK